MTDHPTPQPRGRTAEEILAELYESGYDLGDGFGGSNKSNVKIAQRQLFDAICSEVIGEDDKPMYGTATIGNEARVIGNIFAVKNSVKSELRQRLATFFNQDEAAPPQPEKEQKNAAA